MTDRWESMILIDSEAIMSLRSPLTSCYAETLARPEASCKDELNDRQSDPSPT